MHWDAPLKNAPRGLFEEFTGGHVRRRHRLRPAGTSSRTCSSARACRSITWPAPAPITYSFPVNSTQLNATANVPARSATRRRRGRCCPPGERTLSVTFTPTDTANYNTVTATNTLTVNKATPNVVIEGAGRGRTPARRATAVGKVKDRFNLVIATPTLTYNGSPDPPVMPGTYTVVATFPGNANYQAGSATGTLTITKVDRRHPNQRPGRRPTTACRIRGRD